MRTTIRIDDDLLRELRQLAVTRKVPLCVVANQLLRQGLASTPKKRTVYRERVFSMGAPGVNLDKALSLAADDEDAEVLRKLAVRK